MSKCGVFLHPGGRMGEVASIRENGQTIAATLDRLATLVEESGPGWTVSHEARERAGAHALDLLEACGASDAGGSLALLGSAAELIGAIAVDLAAHPDDAHRLIDQIETRGGVPRVALGREVLRLGQLPELSIDVAIEVQLALLLVFAGSDAVSLWTLWPSGDLKHVSNAGRFEVEAQPTRQAARSLLAGEPSVLWQRESLIGVRIDRSHPPGAALIARGKPSGGDHRELLLRAAGPVLAALLDGQALMAQEDSSELRVMTSVERRLARLRFDLHDGPQQDVHLLAEDLRLFRSQLRPIIADYPNADRLLGRLDDLDAQLVALDGDLRRLSTSVESPFLQPGALPDVLRQITDAFAARTGIEPEARFVGDLTKLTDSQQITLLALIREALSNVHKHSEAHAVTITISSGPGGLEAQVTDDGRGFDPETTLVSAARGGRLGLVGMHERVRMLGGRTHIDSRPGGPTVISATLPPWPSDDPSAGAVRA